QEAYNLSTSLFSLYNIIPRRPFYENNNYNNYRVTLWMTDAAGNSRLTTFSYIIKNTLSPEIVINNPGSEINSNDIEIETWISSNLGWGGNQIHDVVFEYSLDNGTTYLLPYSQINEVNDSYNYMSQVRILPLPYKTHVKYHWKVFVYSNENSTEVVPSPFIIGNNEFFVRDGIAPSLTLLQQSIDEIQGYDSEDTTVIVRTSDLDSGIKNVTLLISINNKPYVSYNSSYIGFNRFNVTIPKTNNNDYVQFIIKAFDHQGNQAEISSSYMTKDTTPPRITMNIQQSTLGEVGEINVGYNPVFIPFNNNYNNPVVFVSTSGINRTNTLDAQYPIINSVSKFGFWLQQLAYNMSNSINVTAVYYSVFEEGTYNVNGNKVEVGSILIDKNSTLINFKNKFTNPTVITNLQNVSTLQWSNIYITNSTSFITKLSGYNISNLYYKMAYIVTETITVNNVIQSGTTSSISDSSIVNSTINGSYLVFTQVSSSIENISYSVVNYINNGNFSIGLESFHPISQNATISWLAIKSGDILGDLIRNSSITIIADILDSGSLVVSIMLSYSINSSIFTNIVMVYDSSTGMYYASTSPVLPNSYIDIFITAVDANGNSCTSYLSIQMEA
ncbi:MAG: hypothetical protein OEZ01_06220, partial [Candidatus Heimdallarchaeota archaeon]|nr:hypothetical protein [Candidatus Heimdallarchaeota archaeon]